MDRFSRNIHILTLLLMIPATLCLEVVIAIHYGLVCVEYIPDHPGFVTKRDCDYAVLQLQYTFGHSGEQCRELQNGRWWIFDLDSRALSSRMMSKV